MVYGIVQAHGGYITCSSELGAGTTFNIYLPVMVEEKRREVSVTEEMPPGGRETILVVDDEELIASLGKRILEKAGYRVLTAYDGRRAIELYENRRGEISLVILDLVMPVMSGKECLGELLKIDPQAKILIASGFSVGTETREILRQGAKGFVNKPFDMRQLLRKVRDVLGAE
jgi:DNA-binding NtrC family response regulator